MRTPLAARRSFAVRCLLTLALVAVPVACSSSRNPSAATTTTTVAATTTTTIAATTTTVAPTTSTTSTTLPPTTTTEPIVTEGGIVKVANASGVNGAAKLLATELGARGFVMRDPTNAVGMDEDLQTSKIYVVAGFEAVANSLSRLLGGIPVAPMPIPAWITGGTEGLGDANVLVMLGHDLAGKHLTDIG